MGLIEKSNVPASANNTPNVTELIGCLKGLVGLFSECGLDSDAVFIVSP
jgi:hypothetical protein